MIRLEAETIVQAHRHNDHAYHKLARILNAISLPENVLECPDKFLG